MKYDDLLNDAHLVLIIELLHKCQDSLIPVTLVHERVVLR